MRSVSPWASATEWLFALGLGEQVLAVSHECRYPQAALALPKATRSLIDSGQSSGQIDQQVKALSAAGAALYELDAELIGRLCPDVIVTQAQCDVCAIRYADVLDLVRSQPHLRRARVVPLGPATFGEILQDVLRLGEECYAATAAQACYETLVQRRMRVKETAARPANEHWPPVAMVEWTDPPMMAGNWTPDLVHDAGGRAILAHPGRHSQYAPWAEIVAAQPEVVVVAPCGFGLERSMQEAVRLAGMPGWNELPAVTGRRAFVVDGDAYFNNSSPRIIDSLELLAWMIHPEHFPTPSGELAEGRAWRRL
jgi:iron complex transport system substrate-binding protein